MSKLITRETEIDEPYELGDGKLPDGLRGCPMGCGRVLRGHEVDCPDCSGQNQYETGGGI